MCVTECKNRLNNINIEKDSDIEFSYNDCKCGYEYSLNSILLDTNLMFDHEYKFV